MWKAGIPAERVGIARCAGFASKRSILEYPMSLAAVISDVVVFSIHFWSCGITFELWALARPELY